jgi:putative aminopeptidase
MGVNPVNLVNPEILSNRMSKHFRLPKTLLLILVFALGVSAQDGGPDEFSLVSWITLDAPPGREYLATDELMRALPGWKRDNLGNLILRKGSGSPRRVIACALDRPGFAVTEITEDGYLRLREAGAGRQHSLWVQFHEGQRIKVLTRTGTVSGVVIVKSTHLQRGRAFNAPVTTLDDLWVDVGATSRADVQHLGIEMLDPVVRDSEGWPYAGFVAGAFAGMRVGCAAVAHAAQGKVDTGETIFLLTTLRSFGHDGLEAALRSLGRVDGVTLLEQSTEGPIGSEGFSQRLLEKPAYLPESTGLTTVTVLAPRVRFPGTLVETVKVSDAEKLFTAVEKVAGVSFEPARRFVSFSLHPSPAQRHDAFSVAADLLKSLADIPAVSGHERPVREAIIAALPAWARPLTRTDNDGNLILEVGPDRDPTMFIAHQDEVGFEVTSIADDGTVSLRTRGGLFLSLWEGQRALLHLDRKGDSPLPGVFVPRDTAITKQPEALTAWFGMDAEGLKKRGVTTGSSVTAFKSATRLGNTRFTARALDDRAGSTALLLAARRITPATLKRKVIFAWSVREETGLEGAIALAKQYASTVKRVYSVDTFVSSDSPAESTRFAYAPLGHGAVIRGLDNSAVAPLPELDRILNIARGNGYRSRWGLRMVGLMVQISCATVCCT